MLRLACYPQPYSLPFLVMPVLLFGQTTAKLALPDSMAKMVNAGISGLSTSGPTGFAPLAVA